MKKSLKIVSYLVLSCVLLLLAFFAYLYSQQNWIKNKTVEQLNGYLNAKVDVRTIGFSVFSHFPYASVVFDDVVIKASSNCQDPLAPNFLVAKKILIDFNWYNVFNSNIKIKKISVENGVLFLWEKNSQKNYLVFKSGKGGKKINLEQIVINDLLVQVVAPQHASKVQINSAQIKGDFYKEEFSLSLASKGKLIGSTLLDFLKMGTKNFNLEGSIYSKKNNVFSFENVILGIGKLNLNVKGRLDVSKRNNTETDISIGSNESEISSLIALFPMLKNANKNLVQKGKLKINVQLKGTTASKNGIECKSKISFVEGTIVKEKIYLKNLAFAGEYLYYTKTKEWKMLDVTFSGKANVGYFNGKVNATGVGKDFKSTLIINGNHPLESAYLLIDIPYFINPKGNALYSVNAKISSKDSIRQVEIDGKVEVTKIGAELKNGTALNADKVEIDFNQRQLNIAMQNMHCLNSFCDAKLQVTNNSTLHRIDVSGNVVSKTLNVEDLEQIIGYFTENKTKGNAEIICNLNIEAEKLQRKKLNVKNFSSQLKLEEKRISLERISFNAMNGSLNGELQIFTNDPKRVSGNFSANAIDVSDLFLSMNNFEQNIITNKNIYGNISGSGQFSFELESNNRISEKSILADAQITIVDGRLKDFSPLYQMSKFIELEELKEIKFKELKNRIQVSNRNVIIPKMDVYTSALNFKMEGTHSFDNIIDYHFELFLKDLLAKKWKKKKSSQDFGVEVEEEVDGSKLFINMKGDAKHPKISYDKEANRKEIKSILKQESSTIKNMFKNEFKRGLRDSTKTKRKKVNAFEKNYFTLEEEAGVVEKNTKTEKLIPIGEEKKKEKKKRKFDKLFKEKEPKKVESTDDY